MSIFNTPFNQNFHSTEVTTIMLIWCLKHVKDFIFTFSMIQQVEVFFSEKQFLDLYTMILMILFL